jgi:hypothetical protein
MIVVDQTPGCSVSSVIVSSKVFGRFLFERSNFGSWPYMIAGAANENTCGRSHSFNHGQWYCSLIQYVCALREESLFDGALADSVQVRCAPFDQKQLADESTGLAVVISKYSLCHSLCVPYDSDRSLQLPIGVGARVSCTTINGNENEVTMGELYRRGARISITKRLILFNLFLSSTKPFSSAFLLDPTNEDNLVT